MPEKIPKESTIQMQAVEYLTILAQQHTDLIFFSIPNEGIMMIMRAFKVPERIIARIVAYFKKMGMLSGVPDLCILYKGKIAFIEFKSPGKTPSEIQKIVHQKFLDAFFFVLVIDSFEKFKIFIDTAIKKISNCYNCNC